MQESTPSVFKKNKENRILLLVDSVLSSESPVWSSIILYQVTHSCCTDTKRVVNVLVTLSDVKWRPIARQQSSAQSEHARPFVQVQRSERATPCVMRAVCSASCASRPGFRVHGEGFRTSGFRAPCGPCASRAGDQCKKACGLAAAGELQRAMQLLERAVAMYPDADYDRQLREVLARPPRRARVRARVHVLAPCKGDTNFARGRTHIFEICASTRMCSLALSGAQIHVYCTSGARIHV